MDRRDFYQETKWCQTCKDYVRYLMSVNHSYCAHCGAEVTLFNKEDSVRFELAVERRKWRATS